MENQPLRGATLWRDSPQVRCGRFRKVVLLDVGVFIKNKKRKHTHSTPRKHTHEDQHNNPHNPDKTHTTHRFQAISVISIWVGHPRFARRRSILFKQLAVSAGVRKARPLEPREGVDGHGANGGA